MVLVGEGKFFMVFRYFGSGFIVLLDILNLAKSTFFFVNWNLFGLSIIFVWSTRVRKSMVFY